MQKNHSIKFNAHSGLNKRFKKLGIKELSLSDEEHGQI